MPSPALVFPGFYFGVATNPWLLELPMSPYFPYYLTSLVDSRNSCTCTGKGNIQREEQAALKQKAMKPSQVRHCSSGTIVVAFEWKAPYLPVERSLCAKCGYRRHSLLQSLEVNPAEVCGFLRLECSSPGPPAHQTCIPPSRYACVLR